VDRFQLALDLLGNAKLLEQRLEVDAAGTSFDPGGRLSPTAAFS
jgi:hypothetical protein